MDGNYKVFSHINDFVCDLADLYGKNQHSLMLYKHLLDKTKITHKDAIRKHISNFRDFLKKNKDAIIEKKPELLKQNDIFFESSESEDFEFIKKLFDIKSKIHISDYITYKVNH